MIVVQYFRAFLTPFASVVSAQGAQRAGRGAMDGQGVVLIHRSAYSAYSVVVVCRYRRVLSAVGAPLLQSRLTIREVYSLRRIRAIRAKRGSFVTLMIYATIGRLIICSWIMITRRSLAGRYGSQFRFLTRTTRATRRVVVRTVDCV